jgi:hypothetical protein
MFIKVTNNDPFDWRNCIMLLNLGLLPGDIACNLKSEGDVVRHGKTNTLRLMDFEYGVNGGGEGFDTRAVLNMAIKCQTPNGLSVHAEV